MARVITEEEKGSALELLSRARAALAAVEHYDQARVDRLCQAIAWATANEETFGRLTRMSVEESGMGSAEGVPARRWKILGILRDALRTKSVGIIEELPDKGIVKYAKPVGRHRRPASRHQPARHHGQHGDQRGEVQGCRHLLAPSPEQKDRARDRSRPSRRPEESRRSRGPHPVSRQTEHPARTGTDGHLRPDDCNRRNGDGEGCLRIGQARVRGWRRQRHGRRR